MSAAFLFLAAAVLTWPATFSHRFTRPAGARRADHPPRPPAAHRSPLPYLAAGASAAVVVGGIAGAVTGATVSVAVGWTIHRARRRRPPKADLTTRLRLPGTLDLIGACLKSGMPVPSALEAVSDTAAPTEEAAALRSTAGLLALGSPPEDAWKPVRETPGLAELAIAAVRTSRSGAAFAGAANDLAEQLRQDLLTEAEERAERAGVTLILPVATCFLPGFFCLGLLPVVLGLATRLSPFL